MKAEETVLQRLEQLEQKLAQLGSISTAAEDISKTKAQSDGLLQQIEHAQRKADDEALRAFNAKQLCEEHAKKTGSIQGQVDVELATITAAKGRCEESERSIQSARASTEEAVRAIASSKEIAANEEKWLAEHLPTARTNASFIAEHRKEVDEAATDVSREVAEMQQALIEAKKVKSEIDEILDKAIQQNAQLATNSTLALEAQKETSESAVKAKNVQQELNSLLVDIELRDRQTSDLALTLEALIKRHGELNAKLESLLPHATSAGLATAFRIQKDRFKAPQKWWLCALIVSLGFLLIVAIPEFWMEFFRHGTAENSPSWDSILRAFVHRLPLVIPLVWLAIYAGRNYSMAIRMEEDYAYKEAISTAFEGYKREMATITAPAESIAPLFTLCDNVLSALSQRPGRIYEGEHADVTPITPAIDAAQKLFKRPSE